MPLDTFYIPPMSCENALFSALLERPYTDGRVVACSRKPSIVRTETKATDGFTVSLPRIQVIHVGLKIFYDSALVGRRQICSGMRELECANGRIMGLQNRLKVERQAIPKCEFSACRAGQYTPSFRCPRHDIDWTTYFICGRMDKLGAQRGRRVTWIRNRRKKIYYVRWSRSHTRYIARIWAVFSQQSPSAHSAIIVHRPTGSCFLDSLSICQLSGCSHLLFEYSCIVNRRWLWTGQVSFWRPFVFPRRGTWNCGWWKK